MKIAKSHTHKNLPVGNVYVFEAQSWNNLLWTEYTFESVTPSIIVLSFCGQVSDIFMVDMQAVKNNVEAWDNGTVFIGKLQ